MDHKFQNGDQVWLHLSKERQHDKGKKLKLIRYGSFTIIRQIDDNAFLLELPPYMQIYSIMNIKNLKLYEPNLVAHNARIMLPPVEDLAPENMIIMLKDTILENNKRSSHSGEHKMWCIRVKGQHPHKAKWYVVDRVKELYPHLILSS